MLSCACLAPTDQSAEVFATLDVPTKVLMRGRTLVLTAHAWRRLPVGSPAELPGATFKWSSSDPGVTLIEPREGGIALVTGLKGGRAEVTASVSTQENAEVATVTIRVGDPLEIDSVTPKSVRYGEQVAVFGLGLTSVVRATLGEATLIPDSLGFSSLPTGEETGRFWVPYPATSDRILLLTAQGASAQAGDTTEVIPHDLYDEVPSTRPVIILDRPSGGGSQRLFLNPALALVNSTHQDQFRLVRADTTRPLSIVVSSTAPNSLDLLVHTVGRDEWNLSLTSVLCRGQQLPLITDTAATRIVRAFPVTPAHELDLTVSGTLAGSYSLEVIDGYLTGDERIAPDRFEDNSNCLAADRNFADPDKRISLDTEFTGSLTIDIPFEVDWFRFAVPPPESGVDTQLVTISWSPQPFGASDLNGLYLLVTDAINGSGEDWTAAVGPTSGGGTLQFQAVPGEYYLVVGDGVGGAIRYGLCMVRGASCSPPDRPPE